MFERYTERARRALFFARYATSTFGGTAIEPEHLLVGLLRERQGFMTQLLRSAQVDPDLLQIELEKRIVPGVRLSTTVEIPFSQQTKDVLYSAASEADRLGHDYIGAEHLLLAILGVPSSAAEVLTSFGINEDVVRQQIT
ncbi:MAG TPA: Clp protease N-terminal domain-containing protein [Vicinamibacterales bacterium]|nr:Clp protease N-terminal domain-containing protein [Vicinamibacterales bacterium]